MGYYKPGRGEAMRRHLPVAIVIDQSGSTETIRKLINRCSQQLIRSMKGSPVLRDIVELLVVHYSKNWKVKVDFKLLAQVEEHDLDIEKSSGCTATGIALMGALMEIDRKKLQWKLDGEPYFQPLLFLLTDGVPDAGKGAPEKVVEQIERTYAEAAEEIRTREQEEKLIFIAAGIQNDDGERADMDKLRELSIHPDRILCVSETKNGIGGVEQFYELIYGATNAVRQNTSISDVVSGFTHA